MRTINAAITLTAFASLGCGSISDRVGPSYYGPESQRPGMPVSTAAGGSCASPPATVTTPTTSNGAAGTPMTAAGAGRGSVPSTPSGAAGGSSTAVAAGTTASAGTPAMTGMAANECDLSGRWLVTVHKVTDGLGNLQTSHNFIYYEIARAGDAYSVKKSLMCATDTIGGGDFAITVDFKGAAAGLAQHVSHNGRKVSSVKTADGCKIDFDKQYMVFGATLPYYLDPSTTLPNADQMATGGMPGWEDWDGDGMPGITGVCAGTVTGKIFTAPREWGVISGTVPNVQSLLRLTLTWDQEPNVMSFDGSPFLGATAVRAADATLHFVQLARLADTQATGDDAAICKSIPALAPMLTPEAAGM